MKQKTASGNLTSLLVGFTAGLIAGILLAPKSGEETRRDIRQTTEQAKDKVEQKFDEAKESIDKKRQSVMDFMNKTQIDEIEIKLRDGSVKKVRPVDLTAELNKSLLEKAEVAVDMEEI